MGVTRPLCRKLPDKEGFIHFPISGFAASIEYCGGNNETDWYKGIGNKKITA